MSETMSTSGIKDDEGDDESELVQTTPEQEFNSKNQLDPLDRQRTDSRDADVSERSIYYYLYFTCRIDLL